MKITVCNDYLIFPVCTRATEKILTFSQKGKTVFSLNIKLDNISPDFYAYVDVSLFRGEALELSVTPEMPIFFSESDEMSIENLYREPMRPQAHFTVKKGWMGPPHALIQTDGDYILAYPFNPVGTEQGNGHWGYAVSRDLLHWTEQRSPLLPETDGIVLRRRARAFLENARQLRLRAERECADIFFVTDKTGEGKWVSLCENGGYLIGDYRDGVFTPEQDEKTLRYASSVGKGVTFADSERVIHMEWDSCPTARFCGQLSVPMELSLEKEAGGYTLTAKPIEALEELYKNRNRYEDLLLGVREIPLADGAHLIRLRGAAADTGVLTLQLFGREMRVDFAANRIAAGGTECPLSLTDGALDLTVVADRLGLEIFADGGRIYMSCLSHEMFMDRNLLSMILKCDMPYTVDLLKVHSFESVW